MLNCAVYGLVRFYVLTSRCLGTEYPGNLLLILGLFSMGIAVPFVLVQKNFRRMLAYSTIDQAGMMITALGIGGKLAAFALMLHMTFHTVAKSLLFLSVRQYLSVLQDRPFPEDPGRRSARASLQRRRLLPGHDGSGRHAAVQPLSE